MMLASFFADAVLRISQHRVICSFLLLSICLLAGHQVRGETVFNTNTLKSRGLDPALAAYFAKSVLFMPGLTQATLRINGINKGLMPLRFGRQGELCIDHALLQDVGLVLPPEATLDETGTVDQCTDFQQVFPTSTLKLLPQEGQVEMVVPASAVIKKQASTYVEGGSAGLINYSFLTSRYRIENEQQNLAQGTLDVGFNAGDWIVRSNQSLSYDQGNLTTDTLYTYAQHTFSSRKTLLQVGEINIQNTLFAGAPITGVQWLPDNALNNNGQNATITGIAQTSEARVEVRQNGMLIYSTLVPLGPFTLPEVPVRNANTPLDVKVIESNGELNQFTVTPDSFSGGGLSQVLGLSFAVGQVRDLDSGEKRAPKVMTLNKGWRLSRQWDLRAGAMAAEHYQALGSGINFSPVRQVALSADLLASQDNLNQNSGQRVSLAAQYQPVRNMTFNLSGSQQTQGYRSLFDAYAVENEDYFSTQRDYNASVSWHNEMVGSFSVGYSYSEARADQDSQRRMSMSWNRRFTHFSATANWQSAVGTRGEQSEGDIAYISVSLPLGKQRVRNYWRKRGRDSATGSQFSGNLTPDSSVSVAADHDVDDNHNSASASMKSNLHYTQLGLSTGQSDDNASYYSSTLSGGIALHQSGITFSPNAIQDTFGVVTVEPPVSGLEMTTSSGRVWTDAWGQAVIPALPAYREAQVELNTASLPKNADVKNGFQKVKMGRGAVTRFNFSLNNVRRVLLSITLPSGEALPKGTVIVDTEGQYVTTAVDQGVLFLSDLHENETLFALINNQNQRCKLIFNLPAMVDMEHFYESAQGMCELEKQG